MPLPDRSPGPVLVLPLDRLSHKVIHRIVLQLTSEGTCEKCLLTILNSSNRYPLLCHVLPVGGRYDLTNHSREITKKQ